MKTVQGERLLGASNAAALLASALAAAVYARWLDAASFAHWTAALAVARLALLLLDGGLRTALVRRDTWPGAAALRLLWRLTACAGGMLALLAAAVAAWAWWGGRMAGGYAVLYAVYVTAYAVAHVASFQAAARLERAGRFDGIARAEGFGTAVEFIAPAALLAAGAPAVLAFGVSVAAGRALRAAWVRRGADAAAPAVGGGAGVGSLLRDGLGLQAVAGLSMLRDHMHLWLLAPWFGAAWAGQFGLAALACALATQAVVQAAARAAVPTLRALPAPRRWAAVRARVRRLAVLVLPPLPLLPAVLAWADAQVWQAQWGAAVALLPWLALRMVPGVAATPVGSWLLVARTPWEVARVHLRWTAVEVALAMLGLWWLGPPGLAVAAAVAAWPGLVLLLHAAEPQARWQPRLRRLLALLLLRRPVLAGGLMGLLVQWQPGWLPWALLALPLVWTLDKPRRRPVRLVAGLRSRHA